MAFMQSQLDERVNEARTFERYFRNLESYCLKPSAPENPEQFILVTAFTESPYYRGFYQKYFLNNPYVTGHDNIKLCPQVAGDGSIALGRAYNSVLDSHDYSKPAWFIFAHCDLEILSDLNTAFAGLDKNCIYGPCGAVQSTYDGNPFPLYMSFNDSQGRSLEGFSSGRDNIKYAGPNLKVDTLDCLCIIVHSDLVSRHQLRFDDHLTVDFVAEDFSMNAMLNFGIETRLINLEGCHHSSTVANQQPERFFKAKAYIDAKYPDSSFAGTCGFIGGRAPYEPVFSKKD